MDSDQHPAPIKILPQWPARGSRASCSVSSTVKVTLVYFGRVYVPLWRGGLGGLYWIYIITVLLYRCRMRHPVQDVLHVVTYYSMHVICRPTQVQACRVLRLTRILQDPHALDLGYKLKLKLRETKFSLSQKLCIEILCSICMWSHMCT